MTTCYPLVRLRERNLEKGTLYPEGMQNYLLTIAPFGKAKRRFYSFWGVSPAEIWIREVEGIIWASEENGTRHWEEKLGAEYRGQSLGFYGSLCMNGNELMIRPSLCIIRPFDQCLQS